MVGDDLAILIESDQIFDLARVAVDFDLFGELGHQCLHVIIREHALAIGGIVAYALELLFVELIDIVGENHYLRVLVTALLDHEAAILRLVKRDAADAHSFLLFISRGLQDAQRRKIRSSILKIVGLELS